MEFGRRNQHRSTSETSRETSTTPGKTTLAERLPPAGHPSVTDSPRSREIGTRTHAPPIPAISSARPSLQMLFRNRSAASEPEQVHAAAARGTATAATQLPHLEQVQRSFGRHDVSGVQAHAGPDAAASAQEMGATAYATGNHVVLGASADLHTVAHEAAHIVQQRAGVHLAGGVGVAGDAYEQHADAVADQVVRGESAEALLDQHARSATSRAGIQRQPARSDGSPDGKHEAADQRQPTGHVERLLHLLTTTQPRPDEQMDEAYAFLASLAVPAMLAAIDGAAGQGALPQLLARSSAAAWFGRAQLLAAIYAVDLVHAPTKSPSDQRLHRASDALDHVSREMQLQILSWMLHRGGVSIEATSLVEGAIAIRADRDAAAASGDQLPPGAGRGAADDPSAAAGTQMGGVVGASITSGAAPAPIMPGPWNPPGKQPGNLYVGNAAHEAIAETYRLAHLGDNMFFNHSPLSTILEMFETLAARRINADALTEGELARRPDIANLSRRHLYEIKPLTAQAEGATKAKLYLDLFKRAGVEMTLGPTGEPGTFGGLPAPDGVFMFESSAPGVITYEYRKGRLVPVPVAEPEAATERRWRWELQPLTPAQKQAIVTTTVGGAMLLILMILFAPVGA